MFATRVRSTQLIVMALAVVASIVVVPAAMRASVGPLARRGASLLRSWSSRLPSPSLALAAEEPPVETALASTDATATMRESAVVGGETRRRAGQRAAVAGRHGLRHIHVGPDAIRRALPASGRPSAVWTSRTADHPAGMLISNPGALAGTIQTGDVVFEVEGKPFASLEELVAVVGQAYQRRAKAVTGRLWRRGEAWTIAVEPGWT